MTRTARSAFRVMATVTPVVSFRVSCDGTTIESRDCVQGDVTQDDMFDLADWLGLRPTDMIQ